ELHLVHRDDIHALEILEATENLVRPVDRHGLDRDPGVARDPLESLVAGIEVGLEHPDVPAGDHRPADAPDEFLALAAEHHAGDHFESPKSLLGHPLRVSSRGGGPEALWSGGSAGVAPGIARSLRTFAHGPHILARPGQSGPRPAQFSLIPARSTP